MKARLSGKTPQFDGFLRNEGDKTRCASAVADGDQQMVWKAIARKTICSGRTLPNDIEGRQMMIMRSTKKQ